MVAEEGLTVSMRQDKPKSGPPFIKTVKAIKSKSIPRVKGGPPATFPYGAAENLATRLESGA
jgi:hypothetical protein